MKKTMKLLTTALCLILCVATLIPCVGAMSMTYTPSDSYKKGPYYTALTNVQLTGNQRADIVAVARSQVGYKEGDNTNQLGGTSSGSKDYTEYGRWYGSYDMWCAMFVSWCANQARISTNVVPKHSYTPTGLQTFKDWGRAYTRAQVEKGSYTPQPGDIIYFKSARNNNPTNHVGIVTGYHNGTVYTIEGNSSKKVAERSYSISNTEIVYICCPKYENSNGGTIVTANCFPKCASSHTSIVSALKSVDADSSYAYRKTIAAANNISGYSGTAAQNTQMLNLLKEGNLVKPDSVTTTTATKAEYYPKCSGSYKSIVDALKSVGADSSYANREKIAAANGISGYSGTAAQNDQMLSLLKAGALKKPGGKAVVCFPKCASSHTSIVSALKSVGADSSYAYRKTIAAANGISGYSGTAAQNTQMLNLLKQGKLIKP